MEKMKISKLYQQVSRDKFLFDNWRRSTNQNAKEGAQICNRINKNEEKIKELEKE